MNYKINNLTFRSIREACNYFNVPERRTKECMKAKSLTLEQAINSFTERRQSRLAHEQRRYKVTNSGMDYYLYRFPVMKLQVA